MPSFAILRVSKIKGWGKLRQVDGHNVRRDMPPNADPTRSAAVLVGSGDAVADVRARLKDAGIDATRLRRNGVLAAELLLTASPEYFRPGRADAAGEWDPDRVAAWQAATLAHLRKQWGVNLVSAGLHLDETTPHIWAIVVPVDETPRKRGPRVRLNAARWFDGRDKLASLQDAYGEAVSSLGLERGVRGSKARHEDIRRCYATIHADAKKAEALREGIQAFVDGRIVEAVGDERQPSFRLAPTMPPAERAELRQRLAPAWLEIWRFVARIAARVSA